MLLPHATFIRLALLSLFSSVRTGALLEIRRVRSFSLLALWHHVRFPMVRVAGWEGPCGSLVTAR